MLEELSRLKLILATLPIDIASAESTFTAPSAKIDPRVDRGPSDFDVRHSFSAAATYNLPRARAGGLAGAFLKDWSVDAIFRARTATPVDLVASAPPLFGGGGIATRPDLVAGVPLYLDDPTVAGGRRINRATFQPGTVVMRTLNENHQDL